MSVFISIPKELGFIRSAPIGGSWAMLVGNPYAKRGYSLPAFCKDIGLRRMDIVWVYNEQMSKGDYERVEKFTHFLDCEETELENVREMNRRQMKKYKGISKEVDDKELLLNRYDSFIEEYDVLGVGGLNLQRTIFDIRLLNDKVARFYSGELSFITDDRLKTYLEAYTPTPLGIVGGIKENFLIEETTRDLLGALQLDGMDESEALDEIVQIGELDPETAKKMVDLPNRYYKIKDSYYYVYNN